MAVSHKNYLAAEEVERVDTWQLPEFGWSPAKVPSAEKEAREKKRREKERAVEVVEDVVQPTPLSAQELDAIRRAAEAEGYQDGLRRGQAEGEPRGREAGRAQAYQETLAEQQRLLQRLNELLDQLSGPLAEQRQQLTGAMASLVQRLTRQLVYAELSTPGPHIEYLVLACLDALPALQPGTRPVVRVHPDDLAYLRGEAVLVGLLERCDWRADAAIQAGGCRVHTAASDVDGQVETRLQALFKAFQDGELPPAAAGEAREGPDAKAPDAGPDQPPGMSTEADALDDAADYDAAGPADGYDPAPDADAGPGRTGDTE